MNRDYYFSLRNRYRPQEIKTVFVFESPPASGKFFYDEEGDTSEPLFTKMMELLEIKAQTKSEGLKRFCERGYFLIDATYTPVNKLKPAEKEKIILGDYQYLMEDLASVGNPKEVSYVLVKANICRLLEPKLKADGFNVVNNGVVVPFPSTGQQKNFHREIAKIRFKHD